MSSAAEEAYGIAMSGTAITTRNTTPNPEVEETLPGDRPSNQTDDQIDNQWLIKLLVDAGLKGDRNDLSTLAQRFHQQPHTLRLIAAYLKRWYAGRLNGLSTITGLADCDNKDALGLVLNAFENKLRGASDLTLLYLLSLSDRPVPQQHMKNVFRSTLMERWLTRRDDYVRFLGPLGRLNTEHWHWVIENLRRLQLLEQPIPGQHDLLFVEEPIRQYFRSNLRARSKNIFEQATQDMEKLFQETVVEFRQRYYSTPEIKTFISPELTAELELEESTQDPRAALWKAPELDEIQAHLAALRNSLSTLKTHAEDLAAHLHTTTPDVEKPSAESGTGIKNGGKNIDPLSHPPKPGNVNEKTSPSGAEVSGLHSDAKGSKSDSPVAQQPQKLTLPPTPAPTPTRNEHEKNSPPRAQVYDSHGNRQSAKSAGRSATKVAAQKLTLPHTALNHQQEATTAGQDTG